MLDTETLADKINSRNEFDAEISDLKEEISMLKEDNKKTILNFYKTLSTQQKLIEHQIKTIDELKIEKDMLLKQFLILLNK
jgi:predicted DNA-binding ArsR family transcriptional regulator